MYINAVRSRYTFAVVDEVGREHLHALVRLHPETKTATETEKETVSETEEKEEEESVTDLAFRVLHFVVIVVSVYRPMRRHPPG